MNVTSVPEFTREVLHRCSLCTYSGEFERAHWPVAPFMLIKRILRKRTLVGKQCGEWSAVIACRVRKFCLVRLAPLEMDTNSRPSTSAASEPASVELTEANIPGAALDEPLDVHNIAICAGGSNVMESSFYIRGKSNSWFQGWVL